MTIKIFTLALDSTEPFLYSEIDELMTDGYEIINTVAFFDGDVPYQRLMLRKDENAAAIQQAAPVKTEVRAIVSIECRETYSQTAQQDFKFFTCVMDNGEKVNVFDHPDKSRNTFEIAENAGWHHLQNLEVGDIRHYSPAIPVVIGHDGVWYSLVNIMHHDLWADLAWHIADGEHPEVPQVDIPRDSDTSAVAESLRQGISFEDDNYHDYSYPVVYPVGDQVELPEIEDGYEQWGEWQDYDDEYWEDSHLYLNPVKGVPRCPKCGVAPLDQRRRDALDKPVTETEFRCVLNHTWQTSDTHD